MLNFDNVSMDNGQLLTKKLVLLIIFTLTLNPTACVGVSSEGHAFFFHITPHSDS